LKVIEIWQSVQRDLLGRERIVSRLLWSPRITHFLAIYHFWNSTGIAFVVEMTQRRDLKDISQTRVFEKPFAKHR